MIVGICPWCKGESYQEHTYIDLGCSVPTGPENCLNCVTQAYDHRFGNPQATEVEMTTGWHRPLDEYPEYLDMNELAYGPALEPSEVFSWSTGPKAGPSVDTGVQLMDKDTAVERAQTDIAKFLTDRLRQLQDETGEVPTGIEIATVLHSNCLEVDGFLITDVHIEYAGMQKPLG